MAYLQRFPVDRPQIIVAEPDGNSATMEARVERYLPLNEEYDTYPIILQQGYVYDIVVFNDGSGYGLRGSGLYGLWTNDWLLDYAGNVIRYQEWSDPWPGTGYNGDFWQVRPTYTGLHYIVVQKDYALYYDVYEGSYGIGVYASYDIPGPLSDVIRGNSWNETLPGYGGDDTISGEGGNDFIQGWHGNDSLLGGAGNDLIDAGSGNDDVNGNEGNDHLYGKEDSDLVRGGQGNDTIFGGDGNDWHLNGNLGDDWIFGEAGNDNLFGGPGNDFLQGFADHDILSGDLGNDTLSGDKGNDLYRGGAGADLFVIADAPGVDAIADFTLADDILSLSRTLAGSREQLAAIAVDASGGLRFMFGGGHYLDVTGLTTQDIASMQLVFW